jgi:hypothetical protein
MESVSYRLISVRSVVQLYPGPYDKLQSLTDFPPGEVFRVEPLDCTVAEIVTKAGEELPGPEIHRNAAPMVQRMVQRVERLKESLAGRSIDLDARQAT